MKNLFVDFDKKNKKQSIFSLGLMLFMITMFFLCNKSIIYSDICNTLNFLQLTNMEIALAYVLIPTNVIGVLSQIIGFLCMLEVVLGICYFVGLDDFVDSSNCILKYNINNSAIETSEEVISGKFLYKENLRFIC